jgi:hypothetical protein
MTSQKANSQLQTKLATEMKTQFINQKTFTLRISTRSPFSEGPSTGELSDFDQSKLYYNCDIFVNDKAMTVKSPIFSKDSDNDRYRAYSIFSDVITDAITRYVLPVEECPQYKFVDGVVTPCDINDQQAL